MLAWKIVEISSDYAERRRLVATYNRLKLKMRKGMKIKHRGVEKPNKNCNRKIRCCYIKFSKKLIKDMKRVSRFNKK